MSRFGRPNYGDAAYAVGVSPDASRVFVTGSTNSQSGPTAATVAYDASTGTKLWDASPDLGDTGYALAVSPDGSKVFVTGGFYATVAYDAATGVGLWGTTYDGPGSDIAFAVGVSPDGSKVFVTGESDGAVSGLDYVTVAYDAATGAQLWAERYTSPRSHSDQALALGVSPDGARVFVIGVTHGSGGSDDWATVAYDAATGAQLWVNRYDGPVGGYDVPVALAVSPDGSKVFATGSSESATGSDYTTIAYDAASGARLWLKRYGGPANGGGGARAVAVSPDGSSLFVTGSIDLGPGDTDYATVAYDTATGSRLWVKRYNGPGDGSANSSDWASALGVSPDGSTVFVTGTSWKHSYDYATIAYAAATGARLWLSRYDGPGNDSYDQANALAVSPDGSKVLVTGGVAWQAASDYTTVAYGTG